MDNLDLDLLRFMQVRENYDKYHKVITKGMMTKESFTLLGDYGAFFKEYPAEPYINNDFKLWFRVTAHPAWKDDDHKFYSTISDNVSGRSQPDISGPFGDQLERLRFDAVLREQQVAFSKGTTSIEDVVSRLDDSTRKRVSVDEGDGSFSLDALAQHQRGDEGLYWRCEDLNRAIGPIRKGDFVVIGKRPEVGGTSFLCSELSYMLEQLPSTGSAVLFNNEEAPDKVYTRMVSGAMGVDYRTMMSAAAHWQTQYDAWLDGRKYKLEHDTSMNINSIYKELENEDHSLIGINVLLKVGGTSAKEDHDKFQALGEECRRISQAYGPVIAVVQADPSAEGMRYIPQDRIYKSKTALQGEADVLIMIGKSDDGTDDGKRFLHVAKNKIPPAPCCDLSLKHLKGEVEFDLGTGRFVSTTFKGNSRCTK